MSSMESSSSWRYISAVKRLSIVLSGTNLLQQILWRDIYDRTWRIFSRESCCTLFRSFGLTIFIVEKTRSTAALLNGSNSSDSMKPPAVALTFFRSLKRPFCACAINVKSSMSSETTKHYRYKCHELFINFPVMIL